MKRYLVNLFLILCSTITVGLTSARAGQAYIGPLTVLQLSTMGVSWGGQTAGNVEIKVSTGLPAGLTCTDTQYLTTKASDVNSSEVALLLMARQTGTPIYLWISDDAAHNAVAGRCSIYSVNF